MTTPMSNSMSMPMPNPFQAYPQNYDPIPQYGGGSSYSTYPTAMYQGPTYPTFVSSVSRPKPFSAPYSSVMDQNIQYVSPEEFAQIFDVAKNIPVTRIAHTQSMPNPMPSPFMDPNNFMPFAVAPKYSTQMSARVKYQGPAFKGNLMPTSAAAPGQQSITVSVQPMPKPNQLPVAAHSYAMVTSEAARPKFSVSADSIVCSSAMRPRRRSRSIPVV